MLVKDVKNMIKIDFYYWEDQCPHNYKIRSLLSTLVSDKRCKINLFDISKNHKIAQYLNIFSPNMIVIDDNLRWHGPISMDSLESILNGIIPKVRPYNVKISNNIIIGDIKDLTEETIIDTCDLCSSSKKNVYCNEKGNWIKTLREKYNLPYIGKLHYLNKVCIGGAEFVPSVAVPYPIPKAEDIAFLTCSFASSEDGDYKTYPLQKLEEELPNLGFNSIIVVASENTPFPNGPLDWFLDKGYMDLGFIYNEERHFAKMHLVKKDLIDR